MDILRVLGLPVILLCGCVSIFFCSYNEEEVMKLMGNNVRPRARYIMQWDQVSIGTWAHGKRQYIYSTLVMRKVQIGIICSLSCVNLRSELCIPFSMKNLTFHEQGCEATCQDTTRQRRQSPFFVCSHSSKRYTERSMDVL